MNTESRQSTNPRGKDSERWAAEYLRKQGYVIRETNARFRGGEIDIVAEDGDTLVFVEVRARRPSLYGTSGESIGSQKRHRMLRAADMYLERHPADGNRSSRIDVIAIQLDRQGRPATVELIKNALEQA